MSTISALCSATMDSLRQTTERPGTARPYGNVRKTVPSPLGRIFKGHCFKGCDNDGMECELVEVVNRLNQIFTSLSIFRHRLALWQLQFKRIQLTAAHVAHD
jgi:hypothetical protein